MQDPTQLQQEQWDPRAAQSLSRHLGTIFGLISKQQPKPGDKGRQRGVVTFILCFLPQKKTTKNTLT